jgi:hypothetical protein
MRSLRLLSLAALTTGLLSVAPLASAQVSINIGAAPACPYGYYDVAPYNCAPYGYYGPEWFSGGVFMARPIFMVMSTITSTRHMATKDPCRSGMRRLSTIRTRSNTSKGMKHATAEAMLVVENAASPLAVTNASALSNWHSIG